MQRPILHVLVGAALCALAACRPPEALPIPEPYPPLATASPSDATIMEPVQSTAEAIQPEASEEVLMTPIPTVSEPSDVGTQQLVTKARLDLSARLDVSIEQIGLVDFQSVTWPDGGLGCPQPGMSYIQVLVEGYLIRLGVGKRVFQYHGGGGRDPFLCENPDPAVAPLNPDQ